MLADLNHGRAASPDMTQQVSAVDSRHNVFTEISTAVARSAGQPSAFAAAVATIAIWVLTGPIFGFSDTWQLVVNTATTIVTFLMVFLIQNSQNRDAAAMQAKLDELIRALEPARNEFIGIEHRTDMEIDRIRSVLEREFGPEQPHSPSRSVWRLSRRH